MLRYSYRNQPTIIWWNLVRLGEDMGELMGAGPRIDDEEFISSGVTDNQMDEIVKRAETLIERAGEEYKAVFMTEYKRIMTLRLGLKHFKDSDFENLFSEWLDTMQELELDFNHSFRKMAEIKMADIEADEQRKKVAERFWHHEGITAMGESDDSARAKIAAWLERWRDRVVEDWGEGDGADKAREKEMKKVNPKVSRSPLSTFLLPSPAQQTTCCILTTP